MSTGKYDADLDKVKKARIRVQQRLLQGNAVNSSDEDDDAAADDANFNIDGVGGKNLKNTTVLHFKRKYKSGAAVQMKRRRAGRFGRQAG